MREILFRGKKLDNGEWVEGAYFKHDTVKTCLSSDDPKPKYLILQDGFCDWGFEPPIHGVAVDPATVGQYTGLTANGKKIFEGDIGRYRQTDGAKRNGAPILCTGKVVYNAETASYAVDSRDDAGCKYFDYFPIKDFEVIGNIHDNPELMEVTT